MPYPDHYRFVIEGEYQDGAGAPVEQWSTSIRIGISGGGPSAALNESDFLTNEGTDFCNRLFGTTRFHSDTVVTKLSFNRIRPDGRYVDQSTSHTLLLSGTDRIRGGSNTTTRFPTQLSVVASLRTARERGPASHGRMYLPMPNVSLDRDYRIDTGQIAAVQGYLIDALQHLDGTFTGTIGGSFFPVLVSPKGTGVMEPVTHAGIGRVVDTMRSRRTSLVEGLAVAAL